MMDALAPYLGIILGALSLFWLMLQRIAPKTETTLDDEVVDIVEGVLDTLGITQDDAKNRARGELKKLVKMKGK